MSASYVCSCRPRYRSNACLSPSHTFEGLKAFFTDILAGFTLNNRVLRLSAIVFIEHDVSTRKLGLSSGKLPEEGPIDCSITRLLEDEELDGWVESCMAWFLIDRSPFEDSSRTTLESSWRMQQHCQQYKLQCEQQKITDTAHLRIEADLWSLPCLVSTYEYRRVQSDTGCARSPPHVFNMLDPRLDSGSMAKLVEVIFVCLSPAW